MMRRRVNHFTLTNDVKIFILSDRKLSEMPLSN